MFSAGCAENGQEKPVIEGETPEVTESPAGIGAEEITIEILEAPERIEGGETFSIRWRVSGGSPGNISDTRILGSQTQEIASVDAYPARSLSQSGTSPQKFEESINSNTWK